MTFEAFLAEIRDDLNDSITEGEAIEMLAQHLITRPVFEALFEGYSFTQNNPVSQAMQAVLEALHEHNLEKEAESLQKFYQSVKRRAAGIDKADAKQKIIVELYDKFFRNAFPKMTERLGIVYTPVEVVDFIIHSVNEVLQSEFGQTLGSKGVHILDPFTGTGTFITRLLQSGLIKPEELEHKYRNEIHANEIILLAYYIAAINIEAAYHGVAGGDYVPFEGICLTDTFQLYEQDRDLISDLMEENSNRRTRQKELDIRVIVGNPPYSVGQGNANDNAANVSYPRLDGRIRETYAARSDATNKNALYDSYIRAIRWASDRIGDTGVIAYVSNAGWIDGNTTDGLRQCLADEFSNIYVFHLRGNQRTSGDRSRREGGKIFGGGSRTPVAITLMVKNPLAEQRGQISFHDIGDYLSREEKLAIVARFASMAGIANANGWQTIAPDEHGDWIGQRDKHFDSYIAMGDKSDKTAISLFDTYSRGIETGRDAWVINSSKNTLIHHVKNMIGVYSAESERLADTIKNKRLDWQSVRNHVNQNPKSISWTRSLLSDLVKSKKIVFDDSHVVPCVEKPFTVKWLYFDGNLNHERGQLPRIFTNPDEKNRVIWVTGVGATVPFSCYQSAQIPSREGPSSAQCFPRYLYDSLSTSEDNQRDMLRDQNGDLPRRDALTDQGLAHFQTAYPEEAVTKDDLYNYVYGLLHSEDYRARYADNLSKQLPRIPAVKKAEDFWAFVEAGRKLGDMHCDFEHADPYPVVFTRGDTSLAAPSDPEAFYRVEQMKFAGKRPNLDKTTVIYNANITMSGIPLEAYDYVVNGKPALEWVMERQCVKTDKASGIVNDANRYAIETVRDPAYPLKLFQRVITVSLETMKIVRSLPKLDIDTNTGGNN